MKRLMMTTGLVLAAALTFPATVTAHGGMMGSGGGMAGTGMMVVADDGSLLVTDMSGTMMDGGATQPSRALACIAPDGSERWTASFTDGWPMMPVTHDDLVVVALVDDWWMGGGMSGDGGWMYGGSGSTTTGDGGSDQVTLVALSLSTGGEVWRTSLDGDMGAMAQFAPDGGRIYVSVVAAGSGMGGGGPMQQGDAAGSGTQMTTTVYALDPADGHTLWSIDLSGGGMGGGGMGEGMAARRQP